MLSRMIKKSLLIFFSVSSLYAVNSVVDSNDVKFNICFKKEESDILVQISKNEKFVCDVRHSKRECSGKRNEDLNISCSNGIAAYKQCEDLLFDLNLENQTVSLKIGERPNYSVKIDSDLEVKTLDMLVVKNLLMTVNEKFTNNNISFILNNFDCRSEKFYNGYDENKKGGYSVISAKSIFVQAKKISNFCGKLIGTGSIEEKDYVKYGLYDISIITEAVCLTAKELINNQSGVIEDKDPSFKQLPEREKQEFKELESGIDTRSGDICSKKLFMKSDKKGSYFLVDNALLVSFGDIYIKAHWLSSGKRLNDDSKLRLFKIMADRNITFEVSYSSMFIDMKGKIFEGKFGKDIYGDSLIFLNGSYVCVDKFKLYSDIEYTSAQLGGKLKTKIFESNVLVDTEETFEYETEILDIKSKRGSIDKTPNNKVKKAEIRLEGLDRLKTIKAEKLYIYFGLKAYSFNFDYVMVPNIDQLYLVQEREVKAPTTEGEKVLALFDEKETKSTLHLIGKIANNKLSQINICTHKSVVDNTGYRVLQVEVEKLRVDANSFIGEQGDLYVNNFIARTEDEVSFKGGEKDIKILDIKGGGLVIEQDLEFQKLKSETNLLKVARNIKGKEIEARAGSLIVGDIEEEGKRTKIEAENIKLDIVAGNICNSEIKAVEEMELKFSKNIDILPGTEITQEEIKNIPSKIEAGNLLRIASEGGELKTVGSEVRSGDLIEIELGENCCYKSLASNSVSVKTEENNKERGFWGFIKGEGEKKVKQVRRTRPEPSIIEASRFRIKAGKVESEGTKIEGKIEKKEIGEVKNIDLIEIIKEQAQERKGYIFWTKDVVTKSKEAIPISSNPFGVDEFVHERKDRFYKSSKKENTSLTPLSKVIFSTCAFAGFQYYLTPLLASASIPMYVQGAAIEAAATFSSKVMIDGTSYFIDDKNHTYDYRLGIEDILNIAVSGALGQLSKVVEGGNKYYRYTKLVSLVENYKVHLGQLSLLVAKDIYSLRNSNEKITLERIIESIVKHEVIGIATRYMSEVGKNYRATTIGLNRTANISYFQHKMAHFVLGGVVGATPLICEKLFCKNKKEDKDWGKKIMLAGLGGALGEMTAEIVFDYYAPCNNIKQFLETDSSVIERAGEKGKIAATLIGILCLNEYSFRAAYEGGVRAIDYNSLTWEKIRENIEKEFNSLSQEQKMEIVENVLIKGSEKFNALPEEKKREYLRNEIKKIDGSLSLEEVEKLATIIIEKSDKFKELTREEKITRFLSINENEGTVEKEEYSKEDKELNLYNEMVVSTIKDEIMNYRKEGNFYSLDGNEKKSLACRLGKSFGLAFAYCSIKKIMIPLVKNRCKVDLSIFFSGVEKLCCSLFYINTANNGYNMVYSETVEERHENFKALVENGVDVVGFKLGAKLSGDIQGVRSSELPKSVENTNLVEIQSPSYELIKQGKNSYKFKAKLTNGTNYEINFLKNSEDCCKEFLKIIEKTNWRPLYGEEVYHVKNGQVKMNTSGNYQTAKTDCKQALKHFIESNKGSKVELTLQGELIENVDLVFDKLTGQSEFKIYVNDIESYTVMLREFGNSKGNEAKLEIHNLLIEEPLEKITYKKEGD